MKSKNSVYISTNQEIKSFTGFINNNKFLLLSICGVALLAFGYIITNFTLTMDSEILIYGNSVKNALFLVQLGRPLSAIITLLFFYYSIIPPFTVHLIAVSTLYLATVILMYSFSKIRNDISKFTYFVFASLFITFPPIIAEYMVFFNYNILVGIGWIFIAISNVLVSNYLLNGNIRSIIFATFFQFFAFAIFQAFIPIPFITALLLLFLYHNKYGINGKDYFKKLIIISIGILTAFIVFTALENILYLIFGTADYAKTLTAIQPISKIINSLSHFKLGHIFSIPSIVMFFIVIIALTFYKLKISIKILYIAIISAIFLLPLMISATIYHTPIRSMQMSLFTNAVIWLIALIILSKYKWVKYFIVVASSVTIIYQVQSLSFLFFTDNMKYQQDIRLVQNIMDRILEKEGTMKINKKLVFVGTGHQEEPRPWIKRVGAVNAPIFNFPKEDRVSYFIGTLGYDIVLNDNITNDLKEVQPYIKDMKVFPHADGIKYLDDKIIIKIGETN